MLFKSTPGYLGTALKLLGVATFIVVVTLAVTPHIAQAFELKLGIVGNLTNSDCVQKGNCGWCDFVDLFSVLQRIILSLFGGLALCMFVWAGISLSTAMGKAEAIAAAWKLMRSTLLGVLIVLGGYMFVVIIVNILSGPSLASTGTCSNNSAISCTSDAMCGAGNTCNKGTGAALADPTKFWHAYCTSPYSSQACTGKPFGTSCGDGQNYFCNASGDCTASCNYLKTLNPIYLGCRTGSTCGTNENLTDDYCPVGQVCCQQSTGG